MAVGGYPGSFDPPTVAHLAIAEAACRHARLERLDLVVSRRTLGKLDGSGPTLDDRVRVLDAVARLPRVLVAPRAGHRVDPHRTVVVERLAVAVDHASVSSTRARAGRTELMLPEAAAFDARTGAWTDPHRYRRERAAR